MAPAVAAAAALLDPKGPCSMAAVAALQYRRCSTDRSCCSSDGDGVTRPETSVVVSAQLVTVAVPRATADNLLKQAKQLGSLLGHPG